MSLLSRPPLALGACLSLTAMVVSACSGGDGARKATSGEDAGSGGSSASSGGAESGGRSGSTGGAGRGGATGTGGASSSGGGGGVNGSAGGGGTSGAAGSAGASGAAGDAGTPDGGGGSSGSDGGGATDASSPTACGKDVLGANCAPETAVATGPGGALVLAYRCDATPRSSVQVTLFQPATGFVDLPNAAGVVTSDERAFDVAIDAAGRVVLAYLEYVDFGTRNLQVVRFDGSQWQPVGPGFPVPSGPLHVVDLELDANRVLVAGCDGNESVPFVSRFDNGDSQWRTYPAIAGNGAIDACSRLAFALDSAHEPLVAFFAYGGTNPPANLRLVRFEATSQTPSQPPVGSWDSLIVDTNPNTAGIIHNPALAIEGDTAFLAYHFEVTLDATRIRRIDLASDLATSANTLLETLPTNAISSSHQLAMLRTGTKLLIASGGQNAGQLLVRAYDTVADSVVTPGPSTLSELSSPGVVLHDGKMLISGSYNGGTLRLECFEIPN